MRSLLSDTENVHNLDTTLRIIRMKKVIATLIAGLFASAAFAQTPAPAATVTTTTTTAAAAHDTKAHAAPVKHTKAKHVKAKHTKAAAHHTVAKTKTVTTVEAAK